MVALTEIHIHAPLLWVAGIIWPPICISIAGARFATRHAQRSKIGIDDWLTLPSLILVLGIGANLLVGVATHSLGYPTPKTAEDAALTSSSQQQTIARKVYWISMLLDIPALTMMKLSCMLFYSRIFHTGANNLTRNFIYAVNFLLIIWGIGFWLSFLLPCGSHWKGIWTNLNDTSKCPLDLIMMHKALIISNVLMDLIIFIFPIPMVLGLQISTAKRFAILGIFFLGALTITMSIIRLTMTIEQASGQYNATADENFISTAGLYFMYNEACFALCAICLPSLSGAFKLKGVQRLMEGFVSIFSNISGSSFRSNKTPNSRSEYRSQYHAEGNSDVELRHVMEDKGITVTSTLDQQSLQK